MPAARYTTLTIYKRLLRQARPYWLHIAGIFLLNLLSTPLVLLTPLPLKLAVDSAIGSQPLPRFLEAVLPGTAISTYIFVLALAAVLLITVTVGNELRDLGSSLLRTYTGTKLVLDFRAQLFRHVQRLSLSYHDTKGTADSVYRIEYDAPAIQYIPIDGVIPFITATLTLTAMIYVMARLDWQLALVALAVSPFLFLLSRLYRLRMRSQWRELKQLESSTLSVVQEALAAIRVVKAFGREEHEEERFVSRSSESIQTQLRIALTEGGLSVLRSLTTVAGTAAVLIIGVVHVKSGVLTLGELLLVMGYLAQFYAPLSIMSRRIVSLQSQLASAERAFSLLDEQPDVAEWPKARPLSRAAGAIAFRNVSFVYGQGRPALHNISFEISPGTRLGIAGRTGAGKTTLVSLLMRFYDPTAGQILLDGIELRDYKLADLRNQFAIVLQEPVLFSTSIAENIAYARPGASYDEIITAAKAANAHEFIARLPQGYDTQVGERGMQLSGGERQRIALARAFLKDAPILILDEPTSSVDVQTETGIMEAIERLMRGRTAFIIAHRLSTLQHCDVLLVIENGQPITVRSDISKAIKDASMLGRREVVDLAQSARSGD